jgi:DNA-binding NtrC family response regulator
LTAALRQSGYAVESARDGFQALEHLARSTPDLVLTDLRMPGMTGIELIQKIHETSPGAPVILVTGADTLDLCTGAETYGAVGCLLKPINLDELLWAIDCALVCTRSAAAASGRASTRVA